jgi:2-keto-4-pentenoate hydratase/2-oxohepta-3-ene-1,7-dioic acid hydratase in catechol pathway
VKLVTFCDPDGRTRCGALTDGQITVMEGIATMRELFESGEDAATVARTANGERITLADVHLKAPIVPKKFFHTSGNYREHEEESKTVNWSHEIAPWIVFFQNVDAIIGPDEPVVYPSHLTNELDHELELALVMSRAATSTRKRPSRTSAAT